MHCLAAHVYMREKGNLDIDFFQRLRPFKAGELAALDALLSVKRRIETD